MNAPLGHEPWMLNSAIVTNLESAAGGSSSDNADTFAGYLTYGAGNPSPDVPSSPSHHVIASSAVQQQVKSHPLMMSSKFVDFLTPDPPLYSVTLTRLFCMLSQK